MHDELLAILKKKRQEKEKITVFSFINDVFLNLYKDFDIDIFRFDINEFADLYGYKDQNRISSNDLLPLIKNTLNIKNKKNNSKLIAIDLPLTETFGDNNFSLQKAVSFYKNSNADLLVINIDHNILELVNKLTKIKIPVIVYAKNNLSINDKHYLQQMRNKLIEAESMGAVMFIIEDFNITFIQDLRDSVSIPVISNEKAKKTDGFYAKFSSVFGILGDNKKKYLNLLDLIKDGINDCIIDNK